MKCINAIGCTACVGSGRLRRGHHLWNSLTLDKWEVIALDCDAAKISSEVQTRQATRSQKSGQRLN